MKTSTMVLPVVVVAMLSGCFTAGGTYAGYRSARASNAEREEQMRKGEPAEPPESVWTSAMAAGTVGLMLDAALLALALKSDLI
ncbi:MAG: hypothetical protein AB7P03_07860 [Kofleriaceae bacterium]